MPLNFALPDAATTWGILGAVLVLCIGGFARWWNSAKPARDRAEAGWDAILGEAAVLDRRGDIINPGKPGLVALQQASDARLAKVEEAVVAINHLTGMYAESMKRHDVTDGRLAEHDSAIAAIIAHTFDVGAKAALEVERLRAANNKSAVDGEVD